MSPQPTTPSAPSTPAANAPGNGAPAANPLAAAVDSLLKIGEGLQKEKEDLLGRIDANRQMLRNLVTQKAATDAQAKAIAAMYPPRKAKEGASS